MSASSTSDAEAVSAAETLYDARSNVVAGRIGNLLSRLISDPVTGLDVGAGDGRVTARLQSSFPQIRFVALERDERFYGKGARAGALRSRWVQGGCARIPFKDNSFDVVTFLSVYEHLSVELRRSTLTEIRRILRPGGYLVGEIPNANFPIEIHSRLPLINFLPKKIAAPYYRKFAPVPEEFRRNGIFWYRVTIRDAKKDVQEAGFTSFQSQGARYDPEILPPQWRWAAGLQRALPPISYDFVCRKPTS